MSARNAAALVSLAVLCGFAIAGCTGFYEIPIETPIQPKMDVSGFQRVLVAGFISGGTEDVDANLETVRLLRSQLRSKSSLRVIEADPLPLVEIAADQQKDNGNGGGSDHVVLEPVAQVGSSDAPPDGQKPPDAQKPADGPKPAADHKPADPKASEPKIKN